MLLDVTGRPVIHQGHSEDVLGCRIDRDWITQIIALADKEGYLQLNIYTFWR